MKCDALRWPFGNTGAGSIRDPRPAGPIESYRRFCDTGFAIRASKELELLTQPKDLSMALSTENSTAQHMNYAPADLDPQKDLPKGFFDYLVPMHNEFTPRQKKLIAKRAEVLQASHRGQPPNYLPPSEATTSEWRIEVPDWCADQRNQMTGPADDAELTVKLLNSGSPAVMIDLEDSMANSWEQTLLGNKNTLAAYKY